MKNPKEAVKTFKTILAEASEFFGVPEHRVTSVQFYYLTARRLPKTHVQLLGGFNAMKAHVAPAPGVPKSKELTSVLQRILKKAA